MIHHKLIADDLFGANYISLNVHSLLSFFNHYMGGNLELKEYINHIIKKGFYTPYQSGLNIFVEEI